MKPFITCKEGKGRGFGIAIGWMDKEPIEEGLLFVTGLFWKWIINVGVK